MDKEYYFSNANIESLNIRDWDKSLVGDSASYNGVSMNSLGIDLIIFGQVVSLDNSTLASASGLAFQDDGKPILGLVKINKGVDYSKKRSQEYFQAIVFHEFIHILGFSIHAFETYHHNVFTRLDDFGFMLSIVSLKIVLSIFKFFLFLLFSDKVLILLRKL